MEGLVKVQAMRGKPTADVQRDSKLLAGLALEARLPIVCQWADMAHAGCPIS